jgi:hypothetical protein
MSAAPGSAGSRWWPVTGAVVVLMDVGATALATTRADRHGPSRATRATITTTPAGTVIARGADAARGLVFEVQSSPAMSDGSLYVHLAPGAPAATRRLIRTRPLVGTCRMPGRRVRGFAGR